jgi:glyoxylase-like metal-dependent hydrolase (beta-lactamase superfamily II)
MHGSATDPLVYPHPTTPQPGELTEVAPGILWLRLALPFQLNHVNIYLIEHDGGWAVVDTGIGDDKTKATWDAVLNGPLKGKKITKLIITHSHPDHLGLASWLVERAKCPLVMSQTEYFNGMYFNSRRTEEQLADQAEFYRKHGIGEEGANALLGRGSNYLTRTTGLPPSYFRVRDGDTHKVGSRDFEVFTGGGHSLEQVMLLSRADKLFLSADQVLSKISPNVSVWSMEPESNALGHYIASLTRLKRDIPDDVLVLPGHGVPFFGVSIRIQQLIDHHAERCGMISVATRNKPLTASEMVPLIFHRPLDAHQAGFATGEVIAHINYMISKGELVKETAADGVMRFKAA